MKARSFERRNYFECYSILKIRKSSEKRIVGVHNCEDPPVPIPNTVVKLVCAENTWLATAREDKSMPTLFLFAPLAQLVEQLTLNQWVPGSNP